MTRTSPLESFAVPANKFNARRTVVDGRAYASRKEAGHCEGLRILERAGKIKSLKLQPRFPLIVNGERVGTYVADAEYIDGAGKHIVIDVKSKATRTAVYRLKKALMASIYGIEVVEV